jgi:subtilisin family serine protease
MERQMGSQNSGKASVFSTQTKLSLTAALLMRKRWAAPKFSHPPRGAWRRATGLGALLTERWAAPKFSHPPRGAWRRATGLGVLLTLINVHSAQAQAAAPASASTARGLYVVQLRQPPVARYDGQIKGLATTRPVAGQRLDTNAPQVRAYAAHLDQERNRVLASSVGPVRIAHRYTVVFNGFAAALTPEQARKLKANAAVLSVTRDEARPLLSNRTPAFLRLSTPGGVWATQRDAQERALRGEDIIIAAIDTGVWPENLSFSDKTNAQGQPVSAQSEGTLVYGPPPARWQGVCQAGAGFATSACNHKLIGARYFNEGFLATGWAAWSLDYASVRDEDGHGSHVLSTAGGNARVPAIVNGLPVGDMSGMAPRARLAAYKACWSFANPIDVTPPLVPGERNNLCFVSDSVAAIEQAVVDGVDVINFSIGGARDSVFDPVEQAFLHAATAGVFVAAAAGNDGIASSVEHISPWLTTVAASTHDRLLETTVRLGDGRALRGASSQQLGLPPRPLVLAADARKAGVLEANASLCLQGTLDAAKVAGKIVVCDRGQSPRVDKSLEVFQTGGVGMLLLNTEADALWDDPHHVPTAHLSHLDREAVRTYTQSALAQAALGAGMQRGGKLAPVMADYSSRGPNTGLPSILKPDLAAPGDDVIAAYADVSLTQAEHDGLIAGGFQPSGGHAALLSGTSMASPHVAGMAALLKQKNPRWSPAAIKSALMTSAGSIKLPDGSRDAKRFGYGAGHLQPTSALNQPVVYDMAPLDYWRFQCALDRSAAACVSTGVLPAEQLNLASLTAAEVLGTSTLQRTLRNVSAATLTLRSFATLSGFDVQVVPPVLTIAPGQRARFEVRLKTTTAVADDWRFGQLVWRDAAHEVRSPLSAQAVWLQTPRLFEDPRAIGTQSFAVKTGYAGTLQTVPTALWPAAQRVDRVVQDERTCTPVTIAARTLWARFALFDAQTSGAGQDDLDLELRRTADDQIVASSGQLKSTELINLPAPEPGAYSICVVGFATQNGVSRYTLSSWLIPDQPASNAAGLGTLNAATASPQVKVGQTSTVNLAWSAPAGKRFFGVVQFKNGAQQRLGLTGVGVGQAATAR